MKKVFLKHIRFLFMVHVLGLIFFSLFRFILLFVEFEHFQALPDKYTLLFKSLVMGLRFDNVISCYIIAIPLIILSITTTFKFEKKVLGRIIIIYLGVLYILSFFICAADIPYFIQFFNRINASIFNWADNTGFVIKMIIQDKSFLFYLLLFLFISSIYIYFLKRIYNGYYKNTEINDLGMKPIRYMVVNFGLSILLLGFCILGIRGRIEKKSPILVGTAFFSNYTFPNQLGLNPVFALMRDALDMLDKENSEFRLMDETVAINNASGYLGINDTTGLFSPVTRKINNDGPPENLNVIVVIMEGMSGSFMSRFGYPKPLTPFLDSLANVSYLFPNVYSSGIHTMNGIYAVLYSYPSLLKQHPLRKVNIGAYNGIAGVLADKGYQTIYFTTHDDQFDNVAGFLLSNGFHQIISQADYPSDRVLCTLGVPDDFMFEYSIPHINNLNKNKKPFFAAMLTAYNHPPVTLPSYFKSEHSVIREQTIEYSDWALRKFFNLCRQQEWFDNTIFVFIADHGGIYGDDLYEIPLSLHHTPLFIYSKKFDKPVVFKQIGGQIDVFPTIMGLLNQSYTNTTLGIDLLNEKRPYIYFSADDKIGCLDTSNYFIYHISGREYLFDLNDSGKDNKLKNMPLVADSMKNYALSMLQTTQWLLKKGKTGIVKSK